MFVKRVVTDDFEGGAFGGMARTTETFHVIMDRHEVTTLLKHVLPDPINPLLGVSAIRTHLEKLLAVCHCKKQEHVMISYHDCPVHGWEE